MGGLTNHSIIARRMIALQATLQTMDGNYLESSRSQLAKDGPLKPGMLRQMLHGFGALLANYASPGIVAEVQAFNSRFAPVVAEVRPKVLDLQPNEKLSDEALQRWLDREKEIRNFWPQTVVKRSKNWRTRRTASAALH